jgi:inner membrane protein involved in colicin E2 resistance
MAILKGIGVFIVAYLIAALLCVAADVIWILTSATKQDLPGLGFWNLVLAIVFTVMYYRNKEKEETKKL